MMLRGLIEAIRSWLRPHAPRLLAAGLTLSAAGIGGIALHEGTVPRVYLDPAGVATSCTGHTKTVTPKDVGKAVPLEVCHELLRADLKEHEDHVRKAVLVPITQGQFDALVSLDFNIGGRAFSNSTLLRKLNAGDCRGAGAEFPRWNRAGGRVLPGLVKRRAAERALFEKGCQ